MHKPNIQKAVYQFISTITNLNDTIKDNKDKTKLIQYGKCSGLAVLQIHLMLLSK